MFAKVFQGSLGLALAACLLTGCNQQSTPTAKNKEPKAKPVASSGGHGWWCTEHGIPEEECSMCLSSAKVKTMFKDKGDWCDKHERAKSQCFICDPKLKEVFAAKYRAKYDKEPPPIEDEEPKKEDKKQ